MSREAEVAYEVCDGVAVLGDYGANEADEAVERAAWCDRMWPNLAPHRVFRVTREEVYP